ncbi:LPS biosynthesis protein WbpP [Candidatus Woesearchaeota archaeon CG11_big_fil_rev_8_21_14_0_20_43_8]|nr:MAG: LPS biosynthesis protein WbpP [Candidatus Woesearchaeota archaeon CG11_big_fil_rev_8_21_14_0_20_43_8]PIO08924.1 MAG: LPS biosynthesis protein WbpP [Candidatus Woesearchaeota archaeon CG08_land_8_20_14_0_20_43_7]
MRYVITGGAGFIGSNIANRLVKEGHDVVIIDNLSTGKEENFEEIKDSIMFYKGDITDQDLLAKAFKGADFVLHQAALASVPRSVKDPLTSNTNNVCGTLKVLIAARDAGVKRVVYAASSSAYGDTETLPKIETMQINPKSPYALQKVTGEFYCRQFYELYGLDTVCLRYFNIFGPKQDPDSEYSAVIPKFIKLMLADKTPVIYGDGTQSRDFTYVDNVVEANLLACKSKGPLKGEAINIGCGERFTLFDLFEMINRILKKDMKPKLAETRAGDVAHSLADIEKAKRLIGFTPLVDFREGLKRTTEWYKNGN